MSVSWIQMRPSDGTLPQTAKRNRPVDANPPSARAPAQRRRRGISGRAATENRMREHAHLRIHRNERQDCEMVVRDKPQADILEITLHGAIIPQPTAAETRKDVKRHEKY